MTATQHGFIPEEKRFALAEDEEGIAIFRATGHGLIREVSADGVTWKTTSERYGPIPLWPVSSGEGVADTDLFCMNAAGRIVSVGRRSNGASQLEELTPIVSTSNWYEAPPPPDGVTLLSEKPGRYRAFFCARRNTGRDALRRGCIGTATSRDLSEWSVEPPLFAPNRYAQLFSPHIVDENGQTTLFYATAEEGGLRAIRFAVAPHLEGPFERLEPDLLCCDARTMMSTVRLGSHRLVFFGRAKPGELHLASVSRPGLLAFHTDGRPHIRFYQELLKQLDRPLFETEVSLESGEPLARILQKHGANVRFSARVRSAGANRAGLILRASLTGHDNVVVWLDFKAGAVTMRRGIRGRLLAQAPCRLDCGKDYFVTLWAEGSFADVYVDNVWILSGSLDGRRSGGFGLAVRGGRAGFKEVRAETLQGT